MKIEEDVFGEAIDMLEAAGVDWQYDGWATEELEDGTKVLTWFVRIAEPEMNEPFDEAEAG